MEGISDIIMGIIIGIFLTNGFINPYQPKINFILIALFLLISWIFIVIDKSLNREAEA